MVSCFDWEVIDVSKDYSDFIYRVKQSKSALSLTLLGLIVSEHEKETVLPNLSNYLPRVTL
jgi:hypothetical protein